MDAGQLRDAWRGAAVNADWLDQQVGVDGWQLFHKGAVCELALHLNGLWLRHYAEAGDPQEAFLLVLRKWGEVMSETKGQIFEVLPKVAAEIGAIGKARRNTQQGYNYRGIEDVMNAVHEPCMKFGLTILPRVTKMTRETWQSKAGADIHVTVLEVTYSFFAPDGSSVEACVVGEGMDSGDKSSNKAMSAALKYALGQVLLIAFEVTDSEKDDHQTQGRAAPMGATPAVPAQPAAPAPRPPSPPKDGTELIARIAAWETRLKLDKDFLLNQVCSTGMTAGHGADMRSWAGPALVSGTETARKLIEIAKKAAEAPPVAPVTTNGVAQPQPA